FFRDAAYGPFVREEISRLHQISGFCLAILPATVLITHCRDFILFFKNIREGWLWTFDDMRWITLMPFSLISGKISLPDEDKFNAGEKINFIMTTVSYLVFSITGFLILTLDDPFIPAVIHVVLAVLTLPVIGGHIFMATINPATRQGLRGMITGYVDREWASHHYRRWFRENFLPNEALQNQTRDKNQPKGPYLWRFVKALFKIVPAVAVLLALTAISFLSLYILN
ncbi:MAG: cytochrome b/b6 domain-containing protein, partial [Nitrospinota bacterium]